MSEYLELSVYRGARAACDACGRKFNRGEVIQVSKTAGKERVFCYGDSDIGSACLESYIQSREFILVNPYRYGSTILPSENQIPNNSPIMVNLLLVAKNPSFNQHVKAYIGSFFR